MSASATPRPAAGASAPRLAERSRFTTPQTFRAIRKSSRARVSAEHRLFVIAAGSETAGLEFRQATDADLPAISKAVLREAMNPLSLKAERFVVAARQSDGAVQGFGQLAPLAGAPQGGPTWLELRSLIVDPDHRGGGIGRRLLAELVRRAGDADIFLTTLDTTAQFYSPQGFRTLDPADIPRSLLFEYWAGTTVARFVAKAKLVVMRRPAGGS